MPRLLIVSTVSTTLEAFLLPYARHFRSQGWQVDGLAKGAESSEACRSAFDNVFDMDWTRSPSDLTNLLRMPGRVRRIVQEGAYDLVHVHTPVAAFVTRLGLRAMRRNGRPKVIYTAHGFHFHRGGSALANAAFAALERLGGRWTDRLVVINEEDRRSAITRRIVAEGSLRYMPGIGLDMALYDPALVPTEAVEAIRHELALSARAPLFLMVAEFNPGKRHEDLLRALAGMECKDAHLALAGRGKLLPRMESLAAELGIQDRVHFLGFRKDIPALMRASLATVLPSEREGLPRSVMESMALGVPVIGASARGTSDLLRDGGGRLFPVGDSQALKEALDWACRRPLELSAMGEAGPGIILGTYGMDQIMRLHEQLYGELLQKGVPAPTDR